MPNPPRKTGTANLVVGIILLLLGCAGIISLSMNNVLGSIIFVFLFIFMAGYEIGKYAENRHANQIKS